MSEGAEMYASGCCELSPEAMEKFLSSMTCPFDVEVRNHRCWGGASLVLKDIKFLDMEEDGATIELTSEQAEKLAAFLEQTA